MTILFSGEPYGTVAWTLAAETMKDLSKTLAESPKIRLESIWKAEKEGEADIAVPMLILLHRMIP